MKSPSCIFFTTLCVAMVSLPHTLSAQGCSDAGFCSIGGLKPEAAAPKADGRGFQRITVLSPFGQGDDAVFVWTPGIQYEYVAAGGWSFQGKLTANYADGNLGSEFGAGDVYLAASKSKALKNNWGGTYTAGVKIPLGTANASAMGMPLPMQYQSTLGTFDLILGGSISNKSWQL